jgi:fumarate reductase flavoprotein subunit
MVERCADCGFDLAAGRVEVVPTAHYMMGGVEFAADCTTERDGLFVAGEDSGGVHGANRLGGNGVANSTVFGGIAGETMARAVSPAAAWREPDADALSAALERARACLAADGAPEAFPLEALRERLYSVMWDDAGIARDALGLARAASALTDMSAALTRYRLPANARDPVYNLAWHDWLNLGSLVSVSRAIVAAAQARRESRGAHFRSDHPHTGDLHVSTYNRVRATADGGLVVTALPVRFTRVEPGRSLLS